MDTTLLADVEPLPNDKDLLSVLDREQASPLSEETLLSFGVEGPEGHVNVYRVIKTNRVADDKVVRHVDASGTGRHKGPVGGGLHFQPRDSTPR